MDEIEEYRNQGSVYQTAFTRLSHHLHNVLEDGFIEEKMMNHFPGVLGAEDLKSLRESVWEETQTVAQLVEQEADERLKWRSILQMMLSYCLYGEVEAWCEQTLTDERIQAVFHSLDDLDEGLTCADPRVRWQIGESDHRARTGATSSHIWSIARRTVKRPAAIWLICQTPCSMR